MRYQPEKLEIHDAKVLVCLKESEGRRKYMDLAATFDIARAARLCVHVIANCEWSERRPATNNTRATHDVLGTAVVVIMLCCRHHKLICLSFLYLNDGPPGKTAEFSLICDFGRRNHTNVRVLLLSL